MSAESCSDLVLAKLGHGADIVLRADDSIAPINGSVSIAHNALPFEHEIIVEFYERNSAPFVSEVDGSPSLRATHLERAAVIPSRRLLEDRIRN